MRKVIGLLAWLFDVQDDHWLFGRIRAVLFAAFFLGPLYYQSQGYFEEPALLRTLQVISVAGIISSLVIEPPKAVFGIMGGLFTGWLLIIAATILETAWHYIWHGEFPDEAPISRAIGFIGMPLLMLLGCYLKPLDKPIDWRIVGSLVVAACAVMGLLLRFWKEIIQMTGIPW